MAEVYHITERIASADGKYSAFECWRRVEIYLALRKELTFPG